MNIFSTNPYFFSNISNVTTLIVKELVYNSSHRWLYNSSTMFYINSEFPSKHQPPPLPPPPANASPRYVICPSRKNNLQNSPSSPLDTPPTVFVCIFFSILKHSWVYQKNAIIKGWKYRPIELLKAELFCHKKQ